MDIELTEESKNIIELLSNERRLDMLVGALEGGSNYWYIITSESYAIISKYRKKEDSLADAMWKAILGGEQIEIWDIEAQDDDEDKFLGHISMESIFNGETQMIHQSNEHWNNIIEENDDAETADVWFQYCVLGSIVYG